MTSTPINQPVKVIDNGIRSFIPPNFCFELLLESGDRLDLVSRLEVTGIDLRDFDVLEMLRQGSYRALGFISEYEAGPEARKIGRQFTIQKVIDELGGDHTWQ